MIDNENIQRIAKLARLSINKTEAEEYGQQLTKVLNHFQQISEVDTAGVEPLVTPVELDFFVREDVVFQEISTEKLLSNAPDRAGNLFKVPPVV